MKREVFLLKKTLIDKLSFERFSYDIKAQISGIFSVSEESVPGKNVLENNTVAIFFPV